MFPTLSRKALNLARWRNAAIARYSNILFSGRDLQQILDPKFTYYRLGFNNKQAAVAVISGTKHEPTAQFYQAPADYLPQQGQPEILPWLKDIKFCQFYGQSWYTAKSAYGYDFAARQVIPFTITIDKQTTSHRLALFEPISTQKPLFINGKADFKREIFKHDLAQEHQEETKKLSENAHQYTKGGCWLKVNANDVCQRMRTERNIDQNEVMGGTALNYGIDLHSKYYRILNVDRLFCLERSIFAPYKDFTTGIIFRKARHMYGDAPTPQQLKIANQLLIVEHINRTLNLLSAKHEIREPYSQEEIMQLPFHDTLTWLDEFKGILQAKTIHELKVCLNLKDAELYKARKFLNSNYRLEWLHAYAWTLTPLPNSTAEEEACITDPQTPGNLGAMDKHCNTQMMFLEKLIHWLMLNAQDEVECWLRPTFNMFLNTDLIETIDFEIKIIDRQQREFTFKQRLSAQQEFPQFLRGQDFALAYMTIVNLINGLPPSRNIPVQPLIAARKRKSNQQGQQQIFSAMKPNLASLKPR